MSKTISFRCRNRKVTLNDDEVISAARAAIEAGLPPEATRHKEWAVEIDGHFISVKWLLSHVSGISRKEFQSQYARDILGRRLGLPVVKEKRSKRSRSSIVTRPVARDDLERWAKLVSSQVAEIRAFLSGRAEHRPSDEKLCDWVQFCYTFGLYTEGCDLFRLIEPSQINDWYYARTRKIADICKLRAR